MAIDIIFPVVLGFLETSLFDVYWPESIIFRQVNVIRSDTYDRPIDIVQPVGGSRWISDVLVKEEPEGRTFGMQRTGDMAKRMEEYSVNAADHDPRDRYKRQESP